jgi:phosphoserine phosphatase RsbU/P
LNTRLVERMRQNNMNSALMVSIFNPESYSLEVANGGMVQPYLRTNGKWENIEVGGYPIGASSRSNYRSQTVSLPPGSMLVMVSDGVVESQNTKNEFFGFDGLEMLLASMPQDITADEITDRIMAAVRNHLGALEPQDDITVVAMKSC